HLRRGRDAPVRHAAPLMKAQGRVMAICFFGGSTRSVAVVAGIAAAILVSTTAHAQSGLPVAGARVELGEICPTAPDAVRDLDLGAAPPPGGSALLDRERVL